MKSAFSYEIFLHRSGVILASWNVHFIWFSHDWCRPSHRKHTNKLKYHSENENIIQVTSKCAFYVFWNIITNSICRILCFRLLLFLSANTNKFRSFLPFAPLAAVQCCIKWYFHGHYICHTPYDITFIKCVQNFRLNNKISLLERKCTCAKAT